MASISTLGIGSTLDLQGILDKLKAVDQAPIDKKKTEITTAQAQINEYTILDNKLLSLKSAALDLSLSGTFLGRTVASTDEKVVSATVMDGATVGSPVIKVTNLAAKDTWMGTAGMATTSTSMTEVDKTVTLQIGADAENSMSIELTAGTTLSQFVDQVNNAKDNPGVVASIVNDGLDSANPYKLVLTSKESGSDHRISGSNLAVVETSGDLDATFTVDGIPYKRQSNVISDVVSGVTLTLKSASTATVTVAENSTGLKDKIVSFVKLYNDVNQEVQSKSAYDETTKDFGILSTTGLRALPFDLQNMMTSSNEADPTGKVRSLYDLGLEIARDGTISIDEKILDAALAASPDAVKSFFIGDSAAGVEGFADKVNNQLRAMTSGTGLLAAERNAAQARIDGTTQQIADQTDRLNKKYEGLTKQFNALDKFMSQMTSIGNYLTGQFDSLNGTTTKNK